MCGEFSYIEYTILSRKKTEGNRPLGRPSRRWKVPGNIKTNITEIEWKCIQLAQEKVERWALENTIMNPRVPQKTLNFLIIWEAISLSIRTLLHEVSFGIQASRFARTKPFNYLCRVLRPTPLLWGEEHCCQARVLSVLTSYFGVVHDLTVRSAMLFSLTHSEGASEVLAFKPGISVSIVSDYGLDNRAMRVLSPAGAKDSSSSLCPDRLWGPSSLLYYGYRGSFPRG
jgi:hypothetical protein